MGLLTRIMLGGMLLMASPLLSAVEIGNQPSATVVIDSTHGERAVPPL